MKKFCKKLAAAGKNLFYFAGKCYTIKQTGAKRFRRTGGAGHGKTENGKTQAGRHRTRWFALLLLLLLVSLGWQLVRINRQVETAQAQKEELAEQVESRQAENDALRADIADGGSQEKKEEIARDELGMVAPGERVFVVN